MNGIGARAAGDVEQLVDPQVGVGGTIAAERPGFVGRADVTRCPVAVGVGRYGGDSCIARRPDDPNGDLATVGDQQLSHNSGLYRG